MIRSSRRGRRRQVRHGQPGATRYRAQASRAGTRRRPPSWTHQFGPRGTRAQCRDLFDRQRLVASTGRGRRYASGCRWPVRNRTTDRTESKMGPTEIRRQHLAPRRGAQTVRGPIARWPRGKRTRPPSQSERREARHGTRLDSQHSTRSRRSSVPSRSPSGIAQGHAARAYLPGSLDLLAAHTSPVEAEPEDRRPSVRGSAATVSAAGHFDDELRVTEWTKLSAGDHPSSPFGRSPNKGKTAGAHEREARGAPASTRPRPRVGRAASDGGEGKPPHVRGVSGRDQGSVEK